MDKQGRSYFIIEIRKSEDNQFFAVLIGRNGEDVFVGETKNRKRNVKALASKWFPWAPILDKTLLPNK